MQRVIIYALKIKCNEAIENCKATIKIIQESLRTENKLYEENKTKAEKKYEEQQQSLKLDELKYNQLISAIRDNKAEKLVKELNGNTLSKIDDNGETALTYAASKGLSKVCLQLIPKMTDQAINTITKTYGTTALTCAAWKGLGEVCIQLISRMPDQTINHITNGGDTALTLAVWNGLEKVSELLIPRMTSQAIQHVNNKGETVLSLVIKNNFKKIYDLFILRINELNNQFNKTNIYKNEEEPQAKILITSINKELIETVNNFFYNPTSINICFQTISDELAELIADKLKSINTTTTINFSGSEISSMGIKIITEALKASKNLEKFDFSCSNLGDQKISILAEILQITTLTNLYLGENDIGIIGIKAIIEASKFNNNIVHLDLHNNNISNEGVKLIAEFLTNNRTLKHLDILGNKITPEGVKIIIEALRENTTITHIDLEQDNIDNTSKTIIEKYLQRNKNLMSFQKLADGINDKVDTNIAINAKDKAIIKDTIDEIIHKAKELNNTTDIETITTSMQELIVDKSTKLKLMIIENKLNEIIDSQNINDDVSMLGGDFVPAAG